MSFLKNLNFAYNLSIFFFETCYLYAGIYSQLYSDYLGY